MRLLAVKFLVFVAFGGLAVSSRLGAATLSPSAKESPAPAGATIEFSPSGGVFATRPSVRLSTSSGVIHFTVDGTEPTARSPRYSKPVPAPEQAPIKARVFSGTNAIGAVAAQTYTVLDKDLADFTSNLPLVVVNTFGQKVDNINRVAASIRIVESRQGRTSWSSEADFDGLASIKVRGHSSLRYPKRSYSVKMVDASGKALEPSILGFPPDNDWILYAPYPDKSLLRDVVAYEMSNQMGHWSARARFVEVFVNDTGGKLSHRHYAGVYVFEEKIKRDKSRVNIAKLEPNHEREPEITGGYIFKKDHLDQGFMMEGNPLGTPPMRGSDSRSYYSGPGGFPADPDGFRPNSERSSRGPRRRVTFTPDGGQPRADEPPKVGGFQLLLRDLLGGGPDGPVRRGGRFSHSETFTTSQGNLFFYEEPSSDAINPAQRQWLANHLNELEAVLYGPDFLDPQRGYRAYLDVDSFIDQHLLVEVTKNIDGFRFSTFYHKDRGGKIKMQPVWDWNLSFGNANGKEGWLTDYWYWPQLDDQQYSWFRRLFEDPDFAQRYVDRYAELRQTVFDPNRIAARIDELAKLLAEAQERNFERWPILNQKIWPNYYVFDSYAEEVNFVKQWIRKRVAWIDAQFVHAPKFSESDSSRTMEISGPGTIYFTLDGSDPRSSGGAASPGARLYRAPLMLKPGEHLVARAKLDHRWSSRSMKQP